MYSAIERATASTYCKSAEPSSSGGVPTAMNTTVDSAMALAGLSEKQSRPACRLRSIASGEEIVGDTSTLAEPGVVDQLIDNRMNR